jgi:hypothetical protein
MKTRIALGLATSLLLLLAAAVFFGPTFCSSKASWQRLTQAVVEDFSHSLTLYAREQGRFPSQKKGLTALVDEGFFKSDRLSDPWGRPFVYACRQPDCTELLVYSIGANGIDEQGKGDDVGKSMDLTSLLCPPPELL